MPETATKGKSETKPETAPVAGPGLILDNLDVRLGADQLRLQKPMKLSAGKLYVLWGPSGSGKSSFVRALLGLGELSSPRMQVSGDVTLTDDTGISHDVWSGNTYNPDARSMIAFLPQSEKLGFIDGLTTVDNLRLYSKLGREQAKVKAEILAAKFHLPSLPDPIQKASGGERMRLSAVRGLLSRGDSDDVPPIVIADEPAAGLDKAAAKSLAHELIAYARTHNSVVIVISHDPSLFTGEEPDATRQAAKKVHVLECTPGKELAPVDGEIGELKIEPGPPENPLVAGIKSNALEVFNYIGGFVLAPFAFLLGLVSLRHPIQTLKRIALDGLHPSTQLFSLIGALMFGGTIAYFIFEQMPRPELIEPILPTEIMQATGHTLIRVVLPLAACLLITAKLGAAQAARLSAGVRNGALETLALANWRVEGFGLVPSILAQSLAMMVATFVALILGVTLAGLVYVGGHEGASLGLAVQLMIDGLDNVESWKTFLWAKILVSGFIGGTIASLFGLAPARDTGDVAKAVHRTLLWGNLGVLATQCLFVIWEFS
ncbi:MAG: ATP-binding cassette domain-containing protein [Planctomycetota bacterium]|jgi:ABC-type lipoprotein export system ATPase subunit/ABC-type transporter Mla maintaining outer membrane lipid asymmetry permease subunit MlaE